MAGIKMPKTTGVSISKPGKVPVPKVAAPRANPTGYHMQPRGFPRVTPPRIKPNKTRIYAKGLGQDPNQFSAGGGSYLPGFGGA